MSDEAYPSFCLTASARAAYDAARAGGWSEWVVGMADVHAIHEGCYFDLPAAERVREFFEKHLRHATGDFKGRPFTLLDWQWRDVIGPLFGWKRGDGRRRFNRGYLSCAKKNGKSGLSAGIALYLLLADGEAGAEVYSAAADRDQASLIYREAVKMILANPSLGRICGHVDSSKTITGPGRCFYKALSAEAPTKEGLNASAIIFDELHAQPHRELWDTLRYAGRARRQPLLLAITTAGSDKESICGEQYEYANRVLSGEVADTSFYARIYEAGMDDWGLEETWRKANPSLGVTVQLDQFRADFLEARESPAKEATFRRYSLNQWVQTADAWLSMDQWAACGADPVAPASLSGRKCCGGLDLSATDDTTALVLLFPADDGYIDVLPWFWLPSGNAHNLERKHRVPYRAWAKKGFITLTEGNVVDYDAVRGQINAIAQQYDIQKLAIDRKFQGQALENDLIADGFDVVPAGQGWISQDLPAKELERLLKAGRIRHGGNPILSWHASNVVVDIDKAGNYSINKRKSRSKIDGIAAFLMALLCHMNGGRSSTVEASGELIVLS
jgi:phage terminase large subunit-like protein